MSKMCLNGVFYYEGDPNIGEDEKRYTENLRVLHRRIRELELENLGLRKRILNLQEALEWRDHVIAIDEEKLRNKQFRLPSPGYWTHAYSKKVQDAYEEYASNMEEGLW